MVRKLSLFVTILLFVFGSIPLSRADSVSAHKRDIVVDNAIGGMREGSRIVSPDTYGKKTQIPKVPGTQISPVMDTRVVAGAPAADTAKAGIFPGGSSSGVAAGVTEGGHLGGGTADSTGGSLIDVDANADLSSGSVDAGLSLDTENTDKILEADITLDSALPAEITESAISPETDIGTEVDTSGGTIGGEADIGVEADVEGGSEGDDVANDPADGLPAPGL